MVVHPGVIGDSLCLNWDQQYQPFAFAFFSLSHLEATAYQAFAHRSQEISDALVEVPVQVAPLLQQPLLKKKEIKIHCINLLQNSHLGR